MKLLSSIIESSSEDVMTAEEFQEYLDVVSDKIPQNVMLAAKMMLRAGILDAESADSLLTASSAKLNQIERESGLPKGSVKDLQKSIKKMKLERRLIPVWQTREEREDFMHGVKTSDDIMLDLVSDRGRADIVRQYTPLMNKIANQYVGKSNLGKEELLSSAMEGLVKAMNQYSKTSRETAADASVDDAQEENREKRAPFLQYAAYRIQKNILHDINWYSRTVRIPGATYRRHKDDEGFQTGANLSLSTQINGDGEEIADRLSELSISPKDLKMPSARSATDNTMKKIYSMIEDRFSMKHASIFYKTFGLNGYQMEKRGDIAKEMGISKQNLSMINKRIAAFLRETPDAQPLLKALLTQCQESILVDMIDKSKQEICEALLSDDMYILLEEITRWQTAEVLESTLRGVLSEYDRDSVEYIVECLNSTKYLQETYLENRKLIVHFLESMNPTDTFNKKQDLLILNEMESLASTFQRSKIEL